MTGSVLSFMTAWNVFLTSLSIQQARSRSPTGSKLQIAYGFAHRCGHQVAIKFGLITFLESLSDEVSFNRIDDQIEQLKTTTATNSNFIRSVIRDCMERFASPSEGPSRLTPNPGQHCSLSYSPEVERPCL